MTTNTLLTNVEISNLALRSLTNWLVFTRSIKANYSDKFGQGGNKIGATYNIRKPVQFKQTSGSNFQAQGMTETYVPLVLDNWVTRDMQFSTEDMTLSIDMFDKRFIEPAMISAANQIDAYNLDKALLAINNIVGTAGTSPADQAAYNTLVKNARVRLANNLAKPQMMNMLGTPDFVGSGSVYNTNVFNSQAVVSAANSNGYLSNMHGFDWYETQILPAHTNGVFTGTPLVNGADQSGSVIATDGFGGGSTLNIGDVVTFAGVYAVNAQTKQAYTHLAQFVITAKNSAGAAQNLQISPAMVGPGEANQNVSALPADNAAVSVVGTTGQVFAQALAYEDDAFAIAFADFAMPATGMGVVSTTSYDKDLGYALTYSKGADIRSFAELHRIDCLNGFVVQRPELATRVAV
jgi:hypothetical protein